MSAPEEPSAPAPQAPAVPAARPARTAAVAVGFAVLAGLLGWQAWRSTVAGPRAAATALAEKRFGIDAADVAAPDFRHQTLDGGTFSVGQSRGQVLFVNFWATWCPPCRDEMPSMLQLGQELSARFPGRFRMVAVSVDDGWEPVRTFFAGRAPAGLTVTLDTDQLATRAYYCTARGACPDSFKFPETYIVDKGGRLVAYMVGPRNWSQPTARSFLERLIEE